MNRYRKIILLSLKIGIGSSLSLYTAQKLGLNYAVSAGTITLLSLMNSKWETIRLSGSRIASFLITVLAGWILFTNISSMWIAYGILLTLIVFMAEILNWRATISVNGVIAAHLVTYENFNDISKTYHTGSVDVPALKQCSLEFGKGEFTAIIGKSGSGKSTLLRILGSMDTPDTGSILIKGEDITHMKDKKLSGFRRRNIGFIYQDYSLFPEFTSYENIVMPILLDGKKPDDAKVDEILSELEISHCKNKYPSEMSGGEQQRVAIARALITSPAVIFADEPTGNLDAGSAETVAKMLSKASQKYEQTIIMVTHDRQMADYADRIITISDGQIQ